MINTLNDDVRFYLNQKIYIVYLDDKQSIDIDPDSVPVLSSMTDGNFSLLRFLS